MSIHKIIGRLVDVTSTSAVLLGKYFSIDGYWNRIARVITHAHSDHTRGLSESIEHSSMIVATPATLELVLELSRIRSSLKYLFKQKAIPLEYNTPLEVMDETITLLPSNHIIGSAQVLVRSGEYALGYTGDFKLEGTPIMRDLDVLVIEATYGNPSYRRPFKKEVEELLVDVIEDGLAREGYIAIYGYYGKLQEVMKIIREKGITDPFIMPPKIYRITKIAEKYGGKIGEYYNIHDREACRIMRYGGRYILFQHMNRAEYRDLRRGLNIILTGWEFRAPVRKIDDNTWIVAFSDHADYDDLINYVKEASPKLVVVENARGGAAYELAHGIRTELGIDAIVLPDYRNNSSSLDSFIK